MSALAATELPASPLSDVASSDVSRHTSTPTLSCMRLIIETDIMQLKMMTPSGSRRVFPCGYCTGSRWRIMRVVAQITSPASRSRTESTVLATTRQRS